MMDRGGKSSMDFLKVSDFQGPRSWGGRGGPCPPPHFSPQMQFVKAFLDHRVTKSCKVTELQLKFEDQIAGNRIFKVSVFNISQGQSARTPLDGSRLQLSTMGPPTLNYAPRSLIFQNFRHIAAWQTSS